MKRRFGTSETAVPYDRIDLLCLLMIYKKEE